MAYAAGARDLQVLLWVASKLRELANDSLCLGDQTLYLMAAEALEKRAAWLAAGLPRQTLEWDGDCQDDMPPVNLII
jgi:hypothetical protein